MRIDTKFGDFTLIGSQYKNENQTREWHLVVWSERDNNVRRYWVIAGKPPEQFAGEDLKAVEPAISKWEAKPVWVL
jgi:hypothetical protein